MKLSRIHFQDSPATSLLMKEARAVYQSLKQEKSTSDNLGWLMPNRYISDDHLTRIEQLAYEIRQKADVLVVIGIGGSNQGARAVIEALGNSNGCEIMWAGNTLSSHEYEKILAFLNDKTFCIDVIAKNFETLEPGIAFRVFRSELQKRYGSKANRYIYATGSPGSYFEQLSNQHGYTFLTFPSDIGGRYSIFSDVGLLPIAVANLDIRALCLGAKDMAVSLDENSDDACSYAVFRNILYEKGYRIEMQSFFEPRLYRFSKWWIQLMAESEGKQKKGIYPVMGCFSEDLHSIGQYVQEGSPIIFETFLIVDTTCSVITLERDGVEDHFDYLDSFMLADVNTISQNATMAAHDKVLPVLSIHIKEISEYELGQLFQFFMEVCAISGRLLGVNPFDQPGVEAYKNLMFENLGKRGLQ